MDDQKPTPVSTAPVAPPAPPVASPAVENIDIEYFKKIQLRVAKIEAAEPVPKSKKLLKLQLDLGPLGKRQIVAGIGPYYPVDSLIGKRIVIVANLQPTQLMGVESQGMLLAAATPDGAQLALLSPGEIPEGSQVR